MTLFLYVSFLSEKTLGYGSLKLNIFGNFFAFLPVILIILIADLNWLDDAKIVSFSFCFT